MTLTELLLAALLAGVVLAVMAVNLRGSGDSAEVQARARLLAETLRALRQEAMASRTPVALVFPNSETQVLSVATGEQEPRFVRTIDRRQEYDEVTMFVGAWAPGTSVSYLATGTQLDSNPGWPSSWLPADEGLAFIFTPTGALVSNGAPHFDGTFHLVVSQGIRHSGGNLQAVCRAQTVCLSPLGDVWIEPKLVNPTGVTQQQVPPAPPPPVAALTLDGAPVTAPVIRSVKYWPTSTGQLLGGADALVAPGGILTLEVEATSPEGVELDCRWTARRLTSAVTEDGALSSATLDRMEWNRTRDAWLALWEWAPPAGVASGDEFELTCEVSDRHGNSAAVDPNVAVLQIEIGDPLARIVFKSDATGFTELYSINSDGSGLMQLTEERSPVPPTRPIWSADHSRLVCVMAVGANSQLALAHAGGFEWKPLPATAFPIVQEPSFDPNGVRLAFVAGTVSGDRELRIADGEGNLTSETSDRADAAHPRWSPNGQWISYDAPDGAGFRRIWLHPVGGSPGSDVAVSPAGVHCGSAEWSPTGDTLVFDSGVPAGVEQATLSFGPPVSASYNSLATVGYFPRYAGDGSVTYRVPGTPDTIMMLDPTLSTLSTVGTGTMQNWSSDGTYVTYVRGNDVFIRDVKAMTPERNLTVDVGGVESEPAWWP